ncbi:MAG: nucleotidyltransferase domain-containing protein [bacterium]
MVKDPDLINSITNELLQLLNERISVDKIILFGSYATGQNTSNSDVDYIITSKAFRNKNVFEISDMTKNIEYILINKFLLPFDLLYYSDLEWDLSNSIPINEAKRHGILQYSSDSH